MHCHMYMFVLTIIILQCVTDLNIFSSGRSSLYTNAEDPTEEVNEKPTRKSWFGGSSSDDEFDWGSFYDPQKLFCGQYDCYKILGFDYFTFIKTPPTRKEITQSYRSLSRKFHPDKSKVKGAKERFVMISKAYKVLTNKETRDEYDYFRDRPDEYLVKYGSSVIWKYKPKSDVRMVVILLLLSASFFTWFAQLQKWKKLADHLTKAAVEDYGRREGGSTESIEVRKKALAILEEYEAANEAEIQAVVSNGSHVHSAKKTPKKKVVGPKLTKKEKKQNMQEELRKIVRGLVDEIDDFGGGYRKPTWKDMFVVQCLFLPIVICKSVLGFTKFYFRRLKGLPYSDEELEVMTKQAVGNVLWDACTVEEHEQMQTMKLWISKNLIEWKEIKDEQILSPGERKQLNRWKKKQGKAD